MKRTRVVLIVVAIAFMVIVALGVLLYHRPPLRVTVAADVVHVDVQTLGEYPTNVARVRLIDTTTGSVVWEVQSHGTAQLSTFELTVGENNVAISHVAWGKFDVVTPERSTFTVERKHPYALEVWGTRLAMTKSRAEFAL